MPSSSWQVNMFHNLLSLFYPVVLLLLFKKKSKTNRSAPVFNSIMFSYLMIWEWFVLCCTTSMLNIIYSVYLDDECSRHGIGCCRWRHHFLDLIRVEKRFLNQMRMMTLSSFHWITLETRTDAGVDYFVQSPHHLDAEKKLHSCCCCCISRRAWIERDDVKFNDKKKTQTDRKVAIRFGIFVVML